MPFSAPNDNKPQRTVVYLSDGTAITAETFGKAIMAQFDMPARQVRVPFVDTLEKADKVIAQINAVHEKDGVRPVVFMTLVNNEIVKRINEACNAMVMDMFSMFINPLEAEFGVKSHHRVGRFSDVSKSDTYRARIDAINYSLMHDDGQTSRDLSQADVILIGVSRSGKTPTSLYLAMQHGLKVANYPLIPEDFERNKLPGELHKYRTKLFGLTIAPERLSQIRQERRPNSRYASLENCRYEIDAAQKLMRRENIRWLESTTKSIEEISATILQTVRVERPSF